MAKEKMDRSRQKDTFIKVLNYMKPYWFYLALSLVLAAVTVALTLYLPKLTGFAVDEIIEQGRVNFAGILQILKLMAGTILITAVAQWIMNICNNKMTYEIVRDIRNEAFRKIEILPLKYIDGHSYGEITSRVIADVDQFADGLLMGFTQLFTGVMTILGTLAGTAVVSIFLSHRSLTDCLAVGSGFGYYSLSSIFITEYKGGELGTVALLANISREILTLLAAPLLVRWFGRLASISAGGATTMDTTLPVILQTAGQEFVVVSIFHGFVVDFSVPFLVTFFCSI